MSLNNLLHMHSKRLLLVALFGVSFFLIVALAFSTQIQSVQAQNSFPYTDDTFNSGNFNHKYKSHVENALNYGILKFNSDGLDDTARFNTTGDIYEYGPNQSVLAGSDANNHCTIHYADLDNPKFCPNITAHRWQAIVWIVRAKLFAEATPEEKNNNSWDLEPLDDNESSGFSDVDSDRKGSVPGSAKIAKFYAAYVKYAKDPNGDGDFADAITTGTSLDTFSPNDFVTREQTASFIVRAFGLQGFYSRADINYFADGDINPTHKKDINALFHAQYTVGCQQLNDDGVVDENDVLKFCPRHSRKIEIFTLLQRAAEGYEGDNRTCGSANPAPICNNKVDIEELSPISVITGPQNDILLGSFFIIGVIASVSCTRIYKDARHNQKKLIDGV